MREMRRAPRLVAQNIKAAVAARVGPGQCDSGWLAKRAGCPKTAIKATALPLSSISLNSEEAQNASRCPKGYKAAMRAGYHWRYAVQKIVKPRRRATQSKTLKAAALGTIIADVAQTLGTTLLLD